MKNLSVYTIASLIKTGIWLLVLLIDATMISVKDDTAIALILGLVGVFSAFWGMSYFLFYWSQWLFSTKIQVERLQKDAYKCAFLFWLFGLLNILLLIADLRSKWLWLASIGIFVVMQYFIFTDPKRKDDFDPSA